MNTKVLSVLLLLIVAIGFSGAASAATKLVSPAYDEQVLVSPAQNVTVVDQEAWNETIHHDAVTHTETIVDQAAYWAWTCYIHYMVPAEYELVHHDAVYETVTVTDVEAYDETIVDVEAYDEKVVDVEAQDAYDSTLPSKTFHKTSDVNKYIAQMKQQYGAQNVQWQIRQSWNYCSCQWDYDVTIFVHHPAVAEQSHIVHHDAVTHVEHHDAVTHEEQQLVSAPYDENVLVNPAHEETEVIQVNTVPNGYFDMIAACSAAVPGWEWIYHPHQEIAAVTHEEVVVDEEAYDEVIEHPAVTHVEEIAAVYETIHHDAVYEDIADPVVKDDDDNGTVVASEPDETIPMQHTGSSPAYAAGIVGAALLVLAGFGLAAFRRDDDEDE